MEERAREGRESDDRRGEESAAASFFFFFFFQPSTSTSTPPHSLRPFSFSNPNTTDENSPRRLRGPLDGVHGRRLDGHGVGAGRGEGLERPGLDLLFVVGVVVLVTAVGLLCRPEEGGHDDARRRSARPLPPAQGRRLGLDRHLELPGELLDSFFLSMFSPR